MFVIYYIVCHFSFARVVQTLSARQYFAQVRFAQVRFFFFFLSWSKTAIAAFTVPSRRFAFW